jgi:transcriptional regulator with XRE-family HTH domain
MKMVTSQGGITMDKMKMGTFLTKLRNEKNLRQQDEADIFQVSPQAVSKWESGDSVPDIATLEKLASFYKVGIDEIINGERKNPDTNVSTVVVARNPSLEEKGIGKRYYGAFIYCMSAIVIAIVLSFLSYFKTDVIIGSQLSMSAGFDFYQTLFKISAWPTIGAWIETLLFLSSALLSIGLWLDPTSRRTFWFWSFGLNLANLVVSLVNTILLTGATNQNGTNMADTGCYVLFIFSVVYFVLFVTLPITKKKTFCPKAPKAIKSK